MYSSVHRNGLLLNYAQGRLYIPKYVVLIIVLGLRGAGRGNRTFVFPVAYGFDLFCVPNGLVLVVLLQRRY